MLEPAAQRSSNTRTAWARRSATNTRPCWSAQTPWGSSSGRSSTSDGRRDEGEWEEGLPSCFDEDAGNDAASRQLAMSSIFSWLTCHQQRSLKSSSQYNTIQKEFFIQLFPRRSHAILSASMHPASVSADDGHFEHMM